MTATAAEPAPPVGAPSLAAFDALTKGAPAPYWLHRGVCAAWGLQCERVDVTLITVSENATFRLDLDGRPVGVVRVSQPGYVGGPEAIASEFAWLGSLHDLDDVDLIAPVPTQRGPFHAVVRDDRGHGWTVVSTRFVEGTVLEDLADPTPYYRTIGRWSALFHQHSRTWQPPYGFTRFTWDLPDMVGPTARWGRWEDAVVDPGQHALLAGAQSRALSLLADLERTPATWGLIHADLRPSNIMAGTDHLTVIDFDDCGWSYYLYDFAASLSFVDAEPYAPAMAQAWVAGYREVAPLTAADLRHAGALAMLRRLQMLGWTTTHRIDALPPALQDQLTGALLCAERFLASPTWLLDA
ncbi:phosphotransferase enzyme family protein [Cellulomonas marina]|uniref:Ser/Thr protein kinase RdoA involved in Cpx stress response, MazF antagonist n=1 Tax=Cellulomonas marina TaxID=988821 RepID=A0A1I1AL41_9CELL|nr:phosphotransferase [Cellulomonas marina]GIG30186.1 aminoglycoside phosphotransferase [Cellulomonas marina]SFB37198.1 Ser/Thr protein kinase RdoA involved in Cpx stress response, MazF antagonist [Cellulomonas marina]